MGLGAQLSLQQTKPPPAFVQPMKEKLSELHCFFIMVTLLYNSVWHRGTASHLFSMLLQPFPHPAPTIPESFLPSETVEKNSQNTIQPIMKVHVIQISVSINKVLLEHSHTPYCLWQCSCYKGVEGW